MWVADCVFQQWMVVQDTIYFHNSFYNLIFKYTWFLHHCYFFFKMWHTLHMGYRGYKCDTHFYLFSEHTNQISALVFFIQEVPTDTMRIFMVYSSHSRYMLVSYLKLGHDCFLPYPFQFIMG